MESAVTEAPAPEDQGTEETPSPDAGVMPPELTGPSSRRPRGRRGSGSSARRGAAPAAPEGTVEEAPSAEEPAPDEGTVIIEPEPHRAPSPEAYEPAGDRGPPPEISGSMPGGRSRGRRGGRGRGDDRPVREELRPRDDNPRSREDFRPRDDRRDDRPRDNRPQRDERPAPPRGRQDGPPGSVESLIARQNVLFEEFANNQSQTLREVQRALTNVSRGGGGASGGFSLPKVGIFLDVPNLIYTAEQLGVRIHFGKLLDYLTEGRQLVRATAYAPITDDPMTRFETQRFVAPVIGHGYKIVSKAWKRFADGSMKANFDIELAVDILTMSDRLDIVVLMSGDGDFRRVVELVESKGVRVEVVAFAASTAMELRAVADSYTDVGQILNIVSV